MFGTSTGNNNSNNSMKNVNTRIRTFYSDTSCMQMMYWNDNISFKLSPMTGVNAEGIRQYDYNRKASTALSQDKCMALSLKVDEVIMPAIDEVRKTGKLSKAVSTGSITGAKKTIMMIEYKPDETNKPAVYFTVYGNLADDGKASPENTFSYKFSKVSVMDNYNPSTGLSDKTEEIEGEFLFFMNKLRTAYETLGTAAHSVNYTGSSQSGGFTRNNNSGFSSNNSSDNYMAPMSGFDDGMFGN